MRRCTRRYLAGFALAASGFQVGCLTGKTLEGGRLDESPEILHEACLDGDTLRVRYTAVRRTEFGDVVGRHERGAAVDAIGLAVPPRLPVDEIAVSPVDPLDVMRPAGCRPVEVRVIGAASEAVPREGLGDRGWVALPAPVLHRDGTAAWVWPLLPLTLAIDTVVTPTLAVLWVVYFPMTD